MVMGGTRQMIASNSVPGLEDAPAAMNASRISEVALAATYKWT